MSVVIGAVFASGILARGPAEGALYAYQPAEREVLERTRRIDAVCARHGVPLAAAALQFPLHHPAVASVIPGPNSPAQVRANLLHMRRAIPSDLWAELKAERLIDAAGADALISSSPQAAAGARRSRKPTSRRCSSSQSASRKQRKLSRSVSRLTSRSFGWSRRTSPRR